MARLAICLLTVLTGLFLSDSEVFSQQTKPAPLFNRDTKLEPDTIEETPAALITRVGDRVRDRHAREWMFHSYDHYLPFYWEHRTVSIEIVDRVAKGGDSITYNFTSLWPLNKPNLRAFFRGIGTVAEYSHNVGATQVDPLHYTTTIKHNPLEKRPIKIGDRIEIEFSPFLVKPPRGRSNYYGTAFLYVVGKGGMVPWEWHDETGQGGPPKKRGANLDSFPLPESAWLGGRATLHEQYSDEPHARFQQMATNLAPVNAQAFVLGRRLHHTDFGAGAHSESGNPVYTEQAGKLGEHYVSRSCVACHAHNGRALPPEIGQPMTKYLVRVGNDAKGTPHPKLGASLQSQSKSGTPEAGITIARWESIDGEFGDGTKYTLRRPVYQFTGVVPEFYSVRIAPPLVGQGLLEAIAEDTIADLAKATKGRMRIVADPETNQPRMGRFGWRAAQARLSHQIASALNNDMGIPTPVFPKLDRGGEQPERPAGKELSADDLDLLYRYVAVLGVPPRRQHNDSEALRGEKLFASAGCVQCHAPTLRTSAYHPLAELRNQMIRPYTDLSLHDMGAGLADNMGEGNATGADWRTPPLWGIGLTRGVSGGEAYLHDGRARDLSEAILWHDGEAEPSKTAFRVMVAADRAALIRFLKSL